MNCTDLQRSTHGRIVLDIYLGHRGKQMLQQSDKIYPYDQVGKAFQDWREAANAWSDLSTNLKQDTGRVSHEQSKRLQALRRQLNKAAEEYQRVRLLTKLGRDNKLG